MKDLCTVAWNPAYVSSIPKADRVKFKRFVKVLASCLLEDVSVIPINKDADYYKYFHNLVNAGLVCGLTHPVEWLVNYSRDMYIFPQEEWPTILKFWGQAARDLFNTVHMAQPASMTQVYEWIGVYYGENTETCSETEDEETDTDSFIGEVSEEEPPF